MTEPIEEQVRKTAEGRDAATPARAILGVALTVWAAAAVLAGVLLVVWWLVAR